MSNPFVLSVSEIATGLSEPVDTSGSSPVHWGGTMMGVAEGARVELHGVLSNLGEAVLIDADVSGEAAGTCVRCLNDLRSEFRVHISDVFGFSPDFITGDELDEEDADEEPLLVGRDDTVDVTQLVVNEAGLTAPFSPVCADYGAECSEVTPAPDGVADDPDANDAEGSIDPRWAALAGMTFGSSDTTDAIDTTDSADAADTAENKE